MNWKPLIHKLLYLKLCYNRAGSHLSIPLGIADKALLLAVFLKVFNLDSYFVVGVAIVAVIALFLVIGHADLRLKIMSKEMSLTNKYNPELSYLVTKHKDLNSNRHQ